MFIIFILASWNTDNKNHVPTFVCFVSYFIKDDTVVLREKFYSPISDISHLEMSLTQHYDQLTAQEPDVYARQCFCKSCCRPHLGAVLQILSMSDIVDLATKTKED